MKKNKKRKTNKINKKLLVIMGIVIAILIGVGTSIAFINGNKKDNNDSKTTTTKRIESQVKIIDENSNSRNVAVMVNNVRGVWGKQAGLQDAYLVYEITVEGGITRFLAIYRDANTEKIGSVRSARPYYIDYVLENDAIYNHVGGSPEAKGLLRSLGINHMEAFTRDRSVSKRTEFTAFTSMKMMMDKANKLKYRTTSNQKLLFDYSAEAIDLSKMDGAIKADEVDIGYNSKNRSYTYDAENKNYKRFQGGEAHKDYVTNKQYTVKNIIVYKLKNSTIAGDKKGRQVLDNIGSGDGYYISNGWAVPIKWEKKKRESQTTYKYLNGDPVVLNDGNTFIQIQPTNKDLTIK